MIKQIIKFSTPILITNFTLFFCMMANRIWAAKFLGANSIAVISLANTILYVVVNLMIAVISASSSLIAQAYGGQKYDKLAQIQIISVYQVIFLSFCLSLGLIALLNNFLIYFNTPLVTTQAILARYLIIYTQRPNYNRGGLILFA